MNDGEYVGRPLLNAAEMRACEAAAIESGAVTGLELMERAGAGAVVAILDEWPDLAPFGRVLVLCGPGNNGGDGFVVARLFKERGLGVRVLFHGDVERLPPDARTAHDRWCMTGEVEDLVAGVRSLDRRDLIVDAIFGTGLTRKLDDPLSESLGRVDFAYPGARRVALDMPSGLCADSGRVLGEGDPEYERMLPLGVDLTLAFHAEKLGHHLHAGPDVCGKVRVVPIGLRGPAAAVRLASPSFAAFDKGGEEYPGAHKYTYGHALVLSGGPGRGGAARLAARAALRSGAGLVTLGCPPAALQENAARLDAVMLRPVRDVAALTEMLADERLSSICIGPGYGLDRDVRGAVATVLATGRRAVLDGDALTAFADDPNALFALLHAKAVLTPHAGEFARLFPDIARRLKAVAETGPAYSKLDATREAAAHAGCTILLKGSDTVIARPDGRAVIESAHYERAAPWLATAGSGDVLAGIITGLLAREIDYDAVATAAWLHTEAALAFGPGLVAEDLPEALPGVYRKLLW